MSKPLDLLSTLRDLRAMGPQAAFEWLDQNEPVHPKQVEHLRYNLWKFDGFARKDDYTRFLLLKLEENDHSMDFLQKQNAELIKIAKDQSGLLRAINNSAYSSAKALKASTENVGPDKQFVAMTALLNGIRWATYVSFGALVYIAVVLANRLH